MRQRKEILHKLNFKIKRIGNIYFFGYFGKHSRLSDVIGEEYFECLLEDVTVGVLAGIQLSIGIVDDDVPKHLARLVNITKVQDVTSLCLHSA